jgi:hypothetical protein
MVTNDWNFHTEIVLQKWGSKKDGTTYGIINYFKIKANITIKHKYKKTKQTY